MSRTVITTKDGTPSIFWDEYDEHYHSIHGALQESIHVFINAGLNYALEQALVPSIQPLRIFEMGFGTGLNAFLTWNECEINKELKVEYTSIEAFPIEKELYQALTYPEKVNSTLPSEAFLDLHQLEWNKSHQLNSDFTIEKVIGLLQDFSPKHTYNIIYYDAFAPSSQPELWSLEIFKLLHSFLAFNGILTTYCAKGDVRRAMQAAGFEVERIPGPPGKREMIRATKK